MKVIMDLHMATNSELISRVINVISLFFPEFLKEEEMFNLYLCTHANIV